MKTQIKSLDLHRDISRKASGLVWCLNSFPSSIGSESKTDVYHKYMNRVSQPTQKELGSLTQDLDWFNTFNY